MSWPDHNHPIPGTENELLRHLFRCVCFGAGRQFAGMPRLEERKKAFESRLHDGKYRKDIGQIYPLVLNVETVVLKRKPVFSPSLLVAAMFMAELKKGFLTAGHDLERKTNRCPGANVKR